MRKELENSGWICEEDLLSGAVFCSKNNYRVTLFKYPVPNRIRIEYSYTEDQVYGDWSSRVAYGEQLYKGKCKDFKQFLEILELVYPIG